MQRYHLSGQKTLVILALVATLLAAAIDPAGATSTNRYANHRCGASCSIPVAAIQAELEAAVTAGVPGVVSSIRAGRRTVVLTAGRADVKTRRPIRASDRFRIASMTKTFVATVVLQLVQERRVGLDDQVKPWLGDVVNDSTITVRQLLQHSSGLFDFGDDQDFISAAFADSSRSWAPAELVAISASHPPYFAPGTGFHYSNTGFVLLGMLIERVTGKPEPQELRRRIFDPLGLEDTYVASDDTIKGRHAHGYTLDANGAFLDVTRMNATLTGASGDIISTVGDVARFEQALLAGRLLGAEMMHEMLNVAPVDDPPVDGYGLGIFSTPQTCGHSFGHGGGIFGFLSEASQLADGSRQSVTFTNTDSIPDAAYPHLAAAARLSICGR